ncbi:hypothetical protein H4R19_003571 [Coemansia spiralis]|nr:hypothetical protein H4R19_003571 [Coemansia spiralis]
MREHSAYSSAFGGRNVSTVSSDIYVAETPYDASIHYYDGTHPVEHHPPYMGQDPIVPTNYPMGVAGDTYSPFTGELCSKPSRQHLLVDQRRPPADFSTHHDTLRSPPSAYSPPAQPAVQHSAAAGRMLRDKSIRDRYNKRGAGGDSGMGECCECCCGGCMRCACCSVCCCMGPILTTALVILVLVGAALALYFNWSRITGSPQKPASNAPTHATNAARALSRHVATSIGGRTGGRLQAILARV